MADENFGRYQIKGQLGRGGVATVYYAYDPRFQRDVVIKVLPRELMADETFRARFMQEAQVSTSLDHPAFVPVYDVGEENG
ncbi:MAG: serine/threonine protein kinase, partial [Chloroflexota bacterium]